MSKKKTDQTIEKNRDALGQGDNGFLEVLTEPIQKRVREPGAPTMQISTIMSTRQLMYGETQCIAPPFDIDSWVLAPQFSTRLNACIAIRTQNTVGMGWELVTKERYKKKLAKAKKETTPEEKEVMDALTKAIEEEKDLVSDFLESPNPERSFTNILRAVITNREAIGNGYMVVKQALVDNDAKNVKKGYPIGLDSLVGHTVRIKSDGSFVSTAGGKTTHYKKWGDESVVNKETGQVNTKGMLPPDQHADCVVHFKIFSLLDTLYGCPRHLATGPAIAGNRFAAERNASFFENDAIPRIAIVVSGPGRLSKDSREDIKEFIERKAKGTTNAGRVMIIQAGRREGSMTEKEDVKIEFHKLIAGTTEDAGYLQYQEKNDKEIGESFNLHPVFFEKESSKASATTGRSITLDQTFEPDIDDIEFVLNNTIMKAFGVKYIWLRLKRPKTADQVDLAEMYQRLARVGGVTPNDIRDFLDKPRFKEPWADYPLPLAVQQLKVPQGRVEGNSLIDSLLELNGMVEKAIRSKDIDNDIDN